MFGYTVEQVLDAAKHCYMNDDFKACEGCALKDACGVNPKALEAEMITHLSIYLDLRNTVQSVSSLARDLEKVKDVVGEHTMRVKSLDLIASDMDNRLARLETEMSGRKPGDSLVISNASYDEGLLDTLLRQSTIGLINQNCSSIIRKDSEEK